MRARLPRRRLARWRVPQWYYPVPLHLVIYRRHAAPAAIVPPARRALWRRGLLSGNWLQRLRAAERTLTAFINRFHRVANFELVVRAFYRGRTSRAAARLAIRLAHRLAGRDPAFRQAMRFERALVVGPAGQLLPTMNLVHRGVRYRLLPWSQLDSATIQRQLARDAGLYGAPTTLRWVFDRRRLGPDRASVVSRLRRQLAARPLAGRSPTHSGWLKALPQLVMLI